MRCLNLSNKEVKAAVDELTLVLGNENAAYYIVSENNGYAIDLAPNGALSKLFSGLLSLFGDDREAAIRAKARLFGNDFRDLFGDWLNPRKDLPYKDLMLDYWKDLPSFKDQLEDIRNEYGLNTAKVAAAAYELVTSQDSSDNNFGFIKNTLRNKIRLAKIAFGNKALKTTYFIADPMEDVEFNTDATNRDEAMMDLASIQKDNPELNLRLELNEGVAYDYLEIVNEALNNLKETDLFLNIYDFINYVKEKADNGVSKKIDENGEPFIADVINHLKLMQIADDTAGEVNQQTDDRNTTDKTLRERLFNEAGDVTIKLMLDKLAQEDPVYKPLIDVLKRNLSGNILNAHIYLSDFSVYPRISTDLKGDLGLFFHESNLIFINETGDFSKDGGKANRTILHEIIHAATVHAYDNDSFTRARIDGELKYVRKLLELKYGKPWRDLAKDRLTRFYGLSDAYEFMAESISNARFIQELSLIPARSSKFKRVIDEFINIVMRALNLKSNDSEFDVVYGLINNIIVNELIYNDLSNTYEAPSLDQVFSDIDLLAHDILPPTVSAMLNITNASEDVEGLVKLYDLLLSQIELNQEGHIYRNKENGKIYLSVTQLKDLVGFGELADKLPAEAKALGEFTSKIGTTIHAIMSDMLLNKFDAKNYPGVSSRAINSMYGIVKLLREKYSIIASELVIFDDDLGVAGTVDLVAQDKKTKHVYILDFKTKLSKLDDKPKVGFSYYHSTKYGIPDADKHNFQVSMYERIHNTHGYAVDGRGIIPIEYEANSDGTITDIYLSRVTNGTTLNEKLFYTMPHRSNIESVIDSEIYKQTSTSYEKSRVDKLSELADKVTKLLRNKVVAQYSRGRNTQAKRVELLVLDFLNQSEKDILISYVVEAFDTLKAIMEGKNGYLEHLNREQTEGNKVWSLKQLETWKDTAESFSLLADIQSYLLDYSDTFDQATNELLMKTLDVALAYANRLQRAYADKGKSLWIEWIRPYINNIEGAYRERAEREYKKNLREGLKLDLDEMQRYIDKYIEENRKRIELETYTFILGQAMKSDYDVSGLYRWVDTIFLSKDAIVQGMALAYDEMTMRTNEEVNKKYKLLVDLTKELELQFTTGVTVDPRLMYDWMIELRDGSFTLISRIPESFLIAKKAFELEVDSDPKYTNQTERNKAKLKWLDENAPIVDVEGYKKALTNAIEEYVVGNKLSTNEQNAIFENRRKPYRKRDTYYEMAKDGKISYKTADDLYEITRNVTMDYRVINSKKFPNAKYYALLNLRKTNPNDIRVRFFDFILSLASLGDAGIAKRYQLNGRLPGVRKTSTERFAATNDLLGVAKIEIKDSLRLTTDDTLYGQYEMTDEQNRPVNFLPVFYTNALSEEDLSFDIPTIYMKWFKSAMLYQNTNSILDQLEFTRYIINNRETSTGASSYASKIWRRMNPDTLIPDSDSTKKESNLAHMLNDWFDTVVYGKGTDEMGTIDMPFVGTIDMRKVMDKFSSYASLRVMGINYLSMVNNALQAEVAQAIEVMASKYVSAKSYTKATAEYMANLPGILGDVGSRKIVNKVNLLDELFGVFNDYSNGNFRLTNKASRLFNSGAFYFTTNVGEHEAQSRFLLASLIETRARDANGNDIGSIYDYYEVIDGNLVFDKDKKVANWDDKTRRRFAARVRHQLMSMHGNYADSWRVALQRNGYLKLALMFRKWIVPTVKKRFISKYYDNILGDWNEGYYRTGLAFAASNVQRFFSKLGMESKALQYAVPADWSKLTEMEKQNVRRFATEAAILSSLFLLYSAIKNFGDDDDIITQNILYQIFRLRTDLGFYHNPIDVFRIVQSPFPSSSSVRSFANFADVLNWFEEYKSGPWKGHYHLTKYTYDLIPVVRQMYRFQNVENEFNILNMK